MSDLPDNGLGSLADELAAAWSDEEEEEEDDEFDVSFANGGTGTVTPTFEYPEDITGIDSTSSSAMSTPQAIRILRAKSANNTPDRKRSRLGREVGSDEEGQEETDGIPVGLEEQLDNIRRLANGNVNAVVSSRNFSGFGYMDEEEEEEEVVEEGVIERLMEGLQKLPPQSNVEAGTTRLITAHAALSSHLTSQTRSLRDLSFTISEPPPEAPEDLLALIPLIPAPNPQPHADLSTLHDLTIDLIAQFAAVSDTLNMTRQSSITANRKLRSAREACAEWKADLQSVERSRIWLEQGGWEEKCVKREAGRVCAEVVGGFEMVCRGFEKRMREMEVEQAACSV